MFDDNNSSNNYCGFQVTAGQTGSVEKFLDYHSNASSIYSGHRFYAGLTLIARLQSTIMDFNSSVFKINGSSTTPTTLFVDNLNQKTAKIVLFSNMSTPDSYPMCAIGTGYNTGQNDTNDSYMNYYCKGTANSGHTFFLTNSTNSYPVLDIQPNKLYHYGGSSYLSCKGTTGHYSYIATMNNNTGTSVNEPVSLQFKANNTNDYSGDASITVQGSSLGAQDSGTMTINANNQLNLGQTSANINIGNQVAYVVNSNFVNIGNQYSTVVITGKLILSGTPSQINVGNHLRQF